MKTHDYHFVIHVPLYESNGKQVGWTEDDGGREVYTMTWPEAQTKIKEYEANLKKDERLFVERVTWVTVHDGTKGE